MYRTLLTWTSPRFFIKRHPRTGEYDWTFPRLIICSNSMHSKQKLLRYGMDQRLIEQFYGSYEEYAGMNRSEWKEIVRKRLIHLFVNQNLISSEFSILRNLFSTYYKVIFAVKISNIKYNSANYSSY